MSSDPAAQWHPAVLRWLQQKTDAAGAAIVELIYELDAEPDSLRQLQMPKEQLFEGAQRGARVLVNPEVNGIRAAVAGDQ